MFNLEQTRALIAEGNLKEALDVLLKQLESTDRRTRKLRDGVIILHSKYQDLNRKETLGLIEADDALREKGQINDGLLSIINDIEAVATPAPEEQPIAPGERTAAKPASPKKWLWLLLLIPVALVAVFWKQMTGGKKGGGAPVPTEVGKRVDVTIESWTITPEPVVMKQPAMIHFEVKNAGTADATGVEVEWWATTTEPKATQSWVIEFLKAGEKKSFDFSYTWKAGSPPSVTARVRVDPNRKIATDDSANNVWEKPVTLKAPPVSRNDLAIVNYTWQPDPAIKGRPVNCMITIQNKGSDTMRNFTLEWWDGVQSYNPIHRWPVERLNAGETKQFNFVYTWPKNMGQSALTIVKLHPPFRVIDIDQSNNIVKKPIPFIASPDDLCSILVRPMQYSPNPIIRGQEARVGFEVVNMGGGEARNFLVYWYASITDTKPAQVWTVDRLAPGAKRALLVQYKWDKNAPLPLRYKVVVDPERRLQETNRADNVKTVELSGR